MAETLYLFRPLCGRFFRLPGLKLVQASLCLAIAVAASIAHAQVYYLAIQGDGTASLVLDEKVQVAYIVDGGRAKTQGIASALINGMPVLDFLAKRKIKTIVFVCSHPHADHQAGLVTMLSAQALNGFKIAFVDNGYEKRTGKESLATIYSNLRGKDAPYASTDNKNVDAFSLLKLRSGDVKVSHFRFEPGSLGTNEHDTSVIMQYDVNLNGNPTRVVDFDDASSKLIELWSKKGKSAANVLIYPHHGSRENKVSPLLQVKNKENKFGIRDVVFTVNRNNRYLHPAPEVLQDMVRRFGADHVFVTDSDADINVFVEPNGAVKYDNGADPRERLAQFVNARVEKFRSTAWSLLESAETGDGFTLKTVAQPASSDAELLAEYADTSSSLSSKKKAELERLMAGLVILEQLAVELGGGSEGTAANDYGRGFAVRTTGKERARGDAETGKEVIASYRQLDGFDGPGGRQPPDGGLSTNEMPNQPSDSGGGGVAQAPNPDVAPQLNGGSGSPSTGGGRGGGGGLADSGSGGAQVVLPATRSFTSNIGRAVPVFGGVILGNGVTGPKVKSMEVVAEGFEDAEDSEPAVILRFTLLDGRVVDYVGVTPDELRVARDFVEPGKDIYQFLEAVGSPGPLKSSSAGVVGMVQIDRFYKLVVPRLASWRFAVHPAFARSRIGIDAMRLDMFLTVATEQQAYARDSLPAYLNAIDFSQYKYSTYQWYDSEARVEVRNEQLTVVPKEKGSGCLMRVRLVDTSKPVSYPPWVSQKGQPSEDSLREDVAAEMIRRGIETPATLLEEHNDALRRSWESDAFNGNVQALCRQFDALKSIDRVARLVSLLNWYKGQAGGSTLPDIPASLAPSKDYLVPATWREIDVLPSEMPAIDWVVVAALAAMAIPVLLLGWILVWLVRKVIYRRRK